SLKSRRWMMKRLLIALVPVLIMIAGTRVLAQVEADPNKDYAMTPEAGAWFICATAYVGPQAPQLAHEMVLELRSRFKLPAYVLNRTNQERQKQEEDLQQIKQKYDELNRLRERYNEPPVAMSRRIAPRIQEQCAVLVGNYKDQETAYQAL